MSSAHIDGLSPALSRIADALETIADPPDRSNAAMATALKAAEQLAAGRLLQLQAVKHLLDERATPIEAVDAALTFLDAVLP